MIDSAIVLCIFMFSFICSHLALPTEVSKRFFARHFSETTYSLCFFFIAVASFAATILWLKYAEPSHLAAFRLVAAPALLVSLLSCLGFVLLFLGLQSFKASPVIRPNQAELKGVFKITRHPFFVGLSLVAWAHLLTAVQVNEQIFFLVLGLYCCVGAMIQDQKLAKRYGESYQQQVAATSLIPFVALISGKQSFTKQDVKPQQLITAIAVTVVVAASHDLFLSYYGAELIVAIAIIGPGLLMWQKAKMI